MWYVIILLVVEVLGINVSEIGINLSRDCSVDSIVTQTS